MSQVIVTPLQCKPGIQRDGTAFSSQRYLDGSWVRFVNNQPKKIGGCISYYEYANQTDTPFITQATPGPQQSMFVMTASSSTLYLTIIKTGTWFTTDGLATTVVPISGLEKLTYADLEYNSGVGSFCELTFNSSLYPHWYFLPAFNALDISSPEAGALYFVNLKPDEIENIEPYTLNLVEDYKTKKKVSASGGVWCAQTFPLIIAYGSNGSLVYNDPFYALDPEYPGQTPLNTWVDENENYYTRQIAQCKIVAMRSTMSQNNVECALAWGLFGLYYLSFDVKTDNMLSAALQITSTVVSTSCSILGQNTVVEANNMYFWIGLGCFYTYNGTVQELPNDTNKLWFFKHINKKYANISFGVLNNQFSEIWWVFPKDAATFCNHAIVYNYQTGVWYDTPFIRSTGCPSTLSPLILFTTPVLPVREIEIVRSTQPESPLQGITAHSYQLYAHEIGVNNKYLEGTSEYKEAAILSHFTYNLTALTTTQNSQNRSILNVMVELDLEMPNNTEMSLRVYNIPYPADWTYGVKSEEPHQLASYSQFYNFNNRKRYIYLQSQGRIVTIRFLSNCIDGDYWMGTCLWHWQYGSVNPSTPDTIAAI